MKKEHEFDTKLIVTQFSKLKVTQFSAGRYVESRNLREECASATRGFFEVE